MPAYDYKCSKCETEFEVERPFGATGSVRCPQCGSVKTDKIFSATGVVFKGSGFYLTDSRSAAARSGGTSAAGKPGDKPTAPEVTETTAAETTEKKDKAEKKAEKGSTAPAKAEKKAKT